MKKLFLLAFIGLLLVGCNSNREVQREDTLTDSTIDVESETETDSTYDVETETKTVVIEVPNYCTKIASEVIGTTSDSEAISLFPEDNGMNTVTLNDGTHEIPEVWYKFDILMNDLGCIRKKVSEHQLKLKGVDHLSEKDQEALDKVELTVEDYEIALEGFSFLLEEFKRIGEENPDLTKS